MVMALGSTGPRKKLLESQTEEFLRRRGAELIGLGAMLVGLTVVLALISYHPSDPGLFAASDEPVQNLLGRIGAALSARLMVSLGIASWLIPLGFILWGARLMLHQGETRIVSSLCVLPFALLACAGFFASHVPGANWAHDFGVGGVLGDAILRLLLGYLPFAAGFSVKIASFLLLLIALLLSAIGLGVNLIEGRSIARFLGNGVDWLRGNGKKTARADRNLTTDDGAIREPVLDRMAGWPEPEQVSMSAISGLFGRLRKREEPSVTMPPVDEDFAQREDVIGARIAAAIRASGHQPEPLEHIDGDGQAPRLSALDMGEETAQSLAGFDEEAASNLPPVPQTPSLVQYKKKQAMAKSERARKEEQPTLAFDEKSEPFQLPPLSLLQEAVAVQRGYLSDDALTENARMLENVLDDYGVKGSISSVRPGPVVTMYELEPAPGLKASRVIGLADDIARSMSALATRVSTIPGRNVIGIELPNDSRETVYLRELLAAKTFGDTRHSLPLALGKDIAGTPVVTNLAKMPHLLIAGTTGSGKSVAINTMVLSLLYTRTPEECRLIMIDPKMLELSVYDGIPHLLSPVVTDPKKAVVALKWVVQEMEERYRKMSKMGVRNIDGYNARVEEALAKGEDFERTVQTGFDDATGEPVFESEYITPEKMPFIVVIVDEMADLMMVAGKEIEACIQRLAQMARASGIHLIMATQRPSVDVITGTIKANFPTRISFQVTSKVDSRTILGEQGAEQLLGMGDMLYMAGGGRISRVHGPFVSDEEVEEVVKNLKLNGAPEYISSVVEGPEDDQRATEIDQVLGLGGNSDGEDALYDQAVAVVARDQKCSTSYIQRKLGVGYNKAATLVERMEEQGVVSAANHVGKREVLIGEPS